MKFSELKWAFYLDVVNARQIFEKHKRKLKDLRPAFWEAFRKLEKAAEGEDWENLKATFIECSKQLGAPGDFGYGHPTGDSLRILYETWNRLCNAAPKTESTTAV